jgi:protein TonB
MFEQSVLTERRRPWTMAVSATLQSAFVGAAMLLSVLSIERLPSVVLPTPLPPLPAAPDPVQIVATEIVRTTAATIEALTPFTIPTRIPTEVKMIVDPSGVPIVANSTGGIVGTGLPVGMYAGTSSVITRSTVPPPPPQPASITEKPAARETPTLRIGGNVLEGKIITRVIPTYPRLAVNARISGTVHLIGIVGRDGLVRELTVVNGHPLLVAAALAAVRQWVYSPTYLNGEAVEVTAPIQVHFTLGR